MVAAACESATCQAKTTKPKMTGDDDRNFRKWKRRPETESIEYSTGKKNYSSSTRVLAAALVCTDLFWAKTVKVVDCYLM